MQAVRKALTATARWTCWAFWCVAYLCRPQPKDFHAYLRMLIRTRVPWWRFRPFVHENHGVTQAYLEDESSYVTRPVEMPVRLMLTHDGERVVGFEIATKRLEAARQALRRSPCG